MTTGPSYLQENNRQFRGEQHNILHWMNFPWGDENWTFGHAQLQENSELLKTQKMSYLACGCSYILIPCANVILISRSLGN